MECRAHALKLLAFGLSLILLYSYGYNVSLRPAAVQAAGEAPISTMHHDGHWVC